MSSKGENVNTYWDDASKKHVTERQDADAQVRTLFQEWFGDVPIIDAREVDGEKIVTFTFEATMVNGKPVVAESVYPSETQEFELKARFFKDSGGDYWNVQNYDQPWWQGDTRSRAVEGKDAAQLYSTCLEIAQAWVAHLERCKGVVTEPPEQPSRWWDGAMKADWETWQPIAIIAIVLLIMILVAVT